MKFVVKKKHSVLLPDTLYDKQLSSWVASSVTDLALKPGDVLDVESSYNIPINIRHSLPSSVMRFWGASFVDEVLYIVNQNYYDTLSFNILTDLENQGIIEELTGSSQINLNLYTDSETAKNKEDEYTGVCPICGSPAYVGLFSVDCPNGCA